MLANFTPMSIVSGINAKHGVPLRRAVLSIYGILIVASIVFRVWHLGNIPGLNGDEADYGIKAYDLLHGRHIGWLTPNGSIYNPLLLLPDALLQCLCKPSIELLRVVAVFSGLAAIVVNYLICRKTLGDTTARITTLLIAVLPTDISQSRLGWGPCQALLADIVVVYLAIELASGVEIPKSKHAWNILACLFALIYAPNIYAVWAMPAAAILRAVRKLPPERRAVAIKVIAGSCVLGLACIPAVKSHMHAVFFMMDRDQNRGLLLGYLSFFSGRNVYAYIAGAPYPGRVFDWQDVAAAAPWVVCAASIVLSIFRRFQVRPAAADILIAAFWAIQLALMAVSIGPAALLPKLDRYSIALIVPAVLLFARSLELVCSRADFRPVVAEAAAALVGILLLAGFYRGYFQPMLRTGGDGEYTFRTNNVDPKEAAIDYIRNYSGIPVHTCWAPT